MTAHIEFRQGNILEAKTDALVNPVNCVGVMGRGLALQFKRAFSENFKEYQLACQRGEVQIGQMFITERLDLDFSRFIINFPTKKHWRNKSHLIDIERGLQALVKDVAHLEIKSISIPPLGAGLGGLDWIEVRDKILTYVSPLTGIHIVIYEPVDKDD